jgi:hypothetical protein
MTAAEEQCILFILSFIRESGRNLSGKAPVEEDHGRFCLLYGEYTELIVAPGGAVFAMFQWLPHVSLSLEPILSVSTLCNTLCILF